MTIEEYKALARRYFEDARTNRDLCDVIFAPRVRFETIQHAAGQAVIESSPEQEKGTYAWLDRVWGDWRLTVDELIAEDDKVVVRWTFHGVQQGEYAGLPATNRPVSYSGINIFRIEDSRIAEVRDIFDRLWLWQQLGVLPETGEMIARARETRAPGPTAGK